MARNLDQSEDKLNTGDSTGLRVLKILVVVMGVLIVAGVVTIVVTIANRMSDKAPPSPAVSVVAPPPKPFGEIAVALPSSARVISVSADAGRLYIRYGRGQWQRTGPTWLRAGPTSNRIINFASDNTADATPEVMATLGAAAPAMPYGDTFSFSGCGIWPIRYSSVRWLFIR
jgi:hypothetical protein